MPSDGPCTAGTRFEGAAEHLADPPKRESTGPRGRSTNQVCRTGPGRSRRDRPLTRWAGERAPAPQQRLADLSPAELAAFRDTQQAAYDALVASGLSLDLTRGKPLGRAARPLRRAARAPDDDHDARRRDARNYGGLAGVTELRAMFAELLGLEVDQLSAQGTSSLTLMKDVLSYLWLKGGVDSERPWGAEEKVRFLCPVPGYDRHFTLLEWFGIEMVPVPMTDDGPDVDAVAALVADDPSIKGMWLVPTYANPTGQVTTQEVGRAARVDADRGPGLQDLLGQRLRAAPPDRRGDQDRRHRVARGGRRAPAPPGRLRVDVEDHVRRRRRRVRRRLTRDPRPGSTPTSASARSAPTRSTTCGTSSSSGRPRACRDHMAKHRSCWRRSSPRSSGSSRSASAGWASRPGPDRAAATSSASTCCPAPRAASSSSPRRPASRSRPPGSAFPYRRDPDDTNIRLAPSYPTLAEVTGAMDAVATCVLLAAAEKLLG